MKKIRLIALCLALLQLLVLFAACDGGEKATTGSKPAATTTGKQPETTQNTGNQQTGGTTTGEGTFTTTGAPDPEIETLCLVENGVARYKIVNPLGGSVAVREHITEFKEEFESITGASLNMITDSYTPESEYEIVVGALRNRPDAKEIEFETPYTSYRMATAGERVVMAAYKEEHYEKLLIYFLEAMYEDDGNWYVDTEMINFAIDFEENEREAPKYATVNGTLQGFGVYESMEDTLVATYEKTSAEEYAAYLASLEAEGYTKYTDNQIGQMQFATYTKADGNTVHTQFNPQEKLVTLNFFRNQYLPATEPAPFTKVTRASANYLQRFGYGGWGLSQIVQLGDGTYIIIDGGKWDQTDFNNMIKFMKDNKPASHTKPIVSLWLMTHPHEDHVEMFAYKAEEFAKHIELKMLGYNIPAEPCSQVDAEGRYWNEYYHHALKAKRDAAFPDAEIWTAHTGQKLYVADAVVEILYTHEDYWPQPIRSANDCNTNYRITIDGSSLLSLGDSDGGGAEMTKMYGDALESDMVQASHHGLNGPLEMYLAMDAKVVFWPDCKTDILQRWENQYNKPWVNTQWTRIDEEGDEILGNRIHYTSSETSKVYFKSFQEE